MNLAARFLVLAVALPAAAQSFSTSLSYGQMATTGQTYAAAPGLTGFVTSSQFPVGTLNVLAIHGSWRALGLGPVALEVTASYQPAATVGLIANLWETTAGIPDALGAWSELVHLRDSQVGAGARLAGQIPLDWTLGFEFRSESLRLSSLAGTLNTTLDRPWLQAGLGYTFPGVGIKPFLAVTWALALTHVANDGGYDTNFLRSMAPKSEVAVQAGARF